ncbi:MAG: 50S ribosomal protein L18 [Planctomycetota bacterium]|nr:50S ribosomal protein L18 [Planctomycetota bacterium]
MKHQKAVGKQRKRRGYSVRNRVKRDSTRPRLSVFRSHKHVYAQIIDDEAGKTLASASSIEPALRDKVSYGGNITAAAAIGEAIANRALEAGVKQAAFDRREYKYHGRVAALADAARDAGLDLGAKAEKKIVEEKKPKGKGKGKGKGKDKKKAGEKKKT